MNTSAKAGHNNNSNNQYVFARAISHKFAVSQLIHIYKKDALKKLKEICLVKLS